MRYYTPEEVNAEKERLTNAAMQQGQALHAAREAGTPYASFNPARDGIPQLQGPSGVSATVRPPTGPKPAEQIGLPPAPTNVPPAGPTTFVSSSQGGVPQANAFMAFTPPNPLSFTTDPSYQWRQNEQQRVLERGAAGRGTLLNGRMQARLMAEGGNLASQEYGNAFNRSLAAYDANRQTHDMNFGNSMTAWQAGQATASPPAGVYPTDAVATSPGSSYDPVRPDRSGSPSYGPMPPGSLSAFAASVAAARAAANAATTNMAPAPRRLTRDRLVAARGVRLSA